MMNATEFALWKIKALGANKTLAAAEKKIIPLMRQILQNPNIRSDNVWLQDTLEAVSMIRLSGEALVHSKLPVDESDKRYHPDFLIMAEQIDMYLNKAGSELLQSAEHFTRAIESADKEELKKAYHLFSLSGQSSAQAKSQIRTLSTLISI
jgi:flagellar biosynthesis/type III secretory pathway protein FliH